MPPILAVVLCGSVDDGKSTVLGRILYDSGQVSVDRMQSVEEDSRLYGTQGDSTDLALLVDGLRDEREQGITIDVAHVGFETPRRRFIVADAPGHEQYTRNMATAASTADLAIVVLDARRGIMPQTGRHTRIVAMFGVRHVVFAVNKMDLVNWDRAVFDSIAAKCRGLAVALGAAESHAIPVSGLTGDNVTRLCAETPWYTGPTLLRCLEEANTADAEANRAFRMPVQYVNRPSPEFRGYCGRVAAGAVAPGDRVRIQPSGVETAVESIVVWQRTRKRAVRGDSIALTLKPEVDVSRGDVIADADNPLEVADQFQARIVWMGDEPLSAGRSYVLALHRCEVGAMVTRIRHRIGVTDGSELAGARLELNDLGVVNLALSRPVPFAPFDECRELGGFILIDRASNATVAAGTITFALMRASNLKWRHFDVDREVRAEMKRQRPRCVWLTGLSASGKSTIANLLEKRLVSEGHHTYLLDGDNVRHGLNRDLGFAEADRVENIRRVAEVASLMVDAGLIVIVSFISPFQSERDFARGLFDPGDFVEVFVDAPLEVCAERDPKGLYAKAMSGEIRNFTGLDSPYERPERPDIRLDTVDLTPTDSVETIMRGLV